MVPAGLFLSSVTFGERNDATGRAWSHPAALRAEGYAMHPLPAAPGTPVSPRAWGTRRSFSYAHASHTGILTGMGNTQKPSLRSDGMPALPYGRKEHRMAAGRRRLVQGFDCRDARLPAAEQHPRAHERLRDRMQCTHPCGNRTAHCKGRPSGRRPVSTRMAGGCLFRACQASSRLKPMKKEPTGKAGGSSYAPVRLFYQPRPSRRIAV